MAIYLSAGHWLGDSGAVGVNGRQENEETIKLRDLVRSHIKPEYRVITDKDTENLYEYLRRIGPGNASVVLELHFDSYNGKASGSTCLVMDGASDNSRSFASDLSQATAQTLGIDNRGCKSESDSARGRLGLVHKSGITALLEVCFIDNPDDMKKYDQNVEVLAVRIANLLMVYDDLIS